MDGAAITAEALHRMTGQLVGVSAWHRIDQPMIDAFAALTKDHQFIHVDPAAAAPGPFGTIVAHGFLTLSLLSVMAQEALPPLENLGHSFNYGFDRVRFVAPVPVDKEVRAELTLVEVEATQAGRLKLTWDVSVMIRGRTKPAIVARWLHLHYLLET